jgi:dihydropyrimidinase
MELPFGGTFAKDTFESGSRAAAFGGTTTIVDFAVQSKGGTLRAGLDTWMAKAEGNTVIDYGFHMIMSDVTDESLAEMDQLVAEGVPDFKLSPPTRASSATTGHLGRAATGEGGRQMHYAGERRSSTSSPADRRRQRADRCTWHAPYPCSTDQTMIRGRGRPVPIASSAAAADALDAVRGAAPGSLVAETCPQYLFLSLDDLGHGFEGAKFVCSPPLRPKDHWDDLWSGLIRDDLQLVATDHCPFDFHGQKELGRGDFRKVPNGLPGVEDRVDLLHDGGVVAGRISKERWVEIISTAPAKLFGMYPRKGAIAVGSDADVVVYDPNRRRTISAASHHMDVDYSCYEGRSVQGASDIVLSRGSVIVRDGAFTGRAGHGQFLRRSRADHVRIS